jgi:hypothetical protein
MTYSEDSGYGRLAADWYCEPPEFVHDLLDVEDFSGVTLDPCCGGGNIPRVFHARGLECLGSDIVYRGFGTVADFFANTTPVDNLVSNPPFELLKKGEFIDHALSIARNKVAIIARLAFLEAECRREFFERVPLARVWISIGRVSMPPGGTNIPAKGGKTCYAWFVFEHGHRGKWTEGGSDA